MKRKLIGLAIIFCVSNSVIAQIDQHFSMFSNTKVQLNPAAAGFYNARYQMMTNYRQQWKSAVTSPFNTYSANFDGRFYEQHHTKGGFAAGGIYFMNDYAADNKYSQLKIVLPMNYAVRIDRKNYFAFGISPSFFQRSIESSDFTWSEQWSGLGFDTDMSSGEYIKASNLSVSKFDIGAGVYWETEIDDFNKMSLGISGNHLTKPKINLFDEDVRMYRTLNVQYYGSFGRDGLDVTIKPSVLWTLQGPNQYLMFGSAFDFLLKGNSKHTGYFNRTSLELGAYLRLNSAFVTSVSLNLGGFSAGFAYDFTVNDLATATGVRGASEFILTYKIGKAKGKGQLDIDDERDQ